MRYQVTLYFNGPNSKWLGRPHESEILLTRTFRWKLFGLGWASGRLKGFANVAVWVDPVDDEI